VTSDTEVRLRDLIIYFLKLGTFGFGGPIVLTGHMRRDLVDKFGWISKDDFSEGMALSQLAPGPLAAQMAIYIGWLKGRILGATLIGIAFVLPSFIMVLALSWFYVKYGGLTWIQGAFYGIGACVIAIIVLSAYKLVRKTFEADWLLWGIGVVSAALTIITESEILWVFLVAGIVAVLIKVPPKVKGLQLFSVAIPAWAFNGINGPAKSEILSDLFFFFSKAGAFVFGSGLAIVPFLHGGVVGEHGWLTERQFIDAVAIAMITPGPVVITVTFIGYLVAGLAGGFVAAIGVFFPCYLFTVIPAPFFRRFAKNQRIKAFVDGVTAAAIGAIAGAAFIIGRRAITDLPTIAIALVSLFILLKTKKVPEPVLILIAGAVGIAFHTA
jgi:chromate transporter